jgi:ribose transport system permease protein
VAQQEPLLKDSMGATFGDRIAHLLPPTVVDLLTSLVGLFFLGFVLTLASPYFLTLSNLANVTRQLAVLAMVSVGMTFVIITAGIDLSVGSVLALAGVVMGSLLTVSHISLPLAIVGGVIAGLLLGLFNGFLIAYADIPPFIVTLGMYSAARGMALVMTNGLSISIRAPEFRLIAEGDVLGFPVPLIIAAVAVALGVYVLGQTTFGRYTYAMGGNEEATRLSGINVARSKMLVYGVAGLCAGVGSILWAARIGSAQPIAGTYLELDAIAAVVIGGTSLAGGRGNIIGTIIGCFIIGIIRNGLNLLNVNPFYQMLVIGAVIVLAVFLDRFRRRVRR